jgi:hypothetical protein
MADEYEGDLIEEQPASTGVDVEMGEEKGEGLEIANASELPFAEGDEEQPVERRRQFIDYLKSPIVTLLVGSGEYATILTAHQALLVQSPYFAEACATFTDDGSVSN